MEVHHGLKGTLLINEPLSKFTSWRVGGKARRVYRPVDMMDLSQFLQALPAGEPLLWIGLGSNLLVRDGGFDGTVILTSGALQNMQIQGNTIIAEAGVYCSKLARQSVKNGLKGAAWFGGIPGTLGGAIAMNAGAHGDETWDFIESVTTIDNSGTLHERKPDEFEVSYRKVKGVDNEWFVAATLKFEHGDAEQEMALLKELLRKRNDSQPTNQPCAGSVFKNPIDDFSGRLIEASGLKGIGIGGASVSTKHANFIVNDGSATAADIEKLILLVQEKIETMQGVRLIPEVHIVGRES